MFNILDYINEMVLIKETPSRYKVRCPHCNSTLVIAKTTSRAGAYMCTAGCDPIDIKSALGVKTKTNNNNYNFIPPKKTLKILPVKEGKFYRFKEIPVSYLKEDNCTYYLYSRDFRVERIDKKTGKICIGYYLVKGKMERIDRCNLSKQEKIIKSTFYYLPKKKEELKGKIALMVEGEKCVNCIMKRTRICAITPPGHGWTREWLKYHLVRLPVNGIIMIPDHDKAGWHKRDLVQSICAELYIPFTSISFSFLNEEVDVADLSDEQFIQVEAKLKKWM